DGTSNWGGNASGMDCTVLGKYGTGCEFDGVDDYVSISSTFSLSNTNVTFGAWVYLSSASLKGTFIKIGKAVGMENEDGYGIGVGSGDLETSGNELIGIYEGIRWIDTNTNIGTGWHHAVMVIDSSGVPSFYLDGTSLGSFSGTNARVPSVESFIGGYNARGTGPRFFNGLVDDVRIYDYAMSQAQVAWEYNRGKPIGHWEFDECQGTIANDTMGNYNGTIAIGDGGSQDDSGTCTDGDTTHAWYNGRTGKFFSAMSFDGTDDIVSVNDNSNLRQNGNFSLSFWYKVTDYGS
ncbi:unnamed protein product, partial [marine sediment metagenome]